LKVEEAARKEEEAKQKKLDEERNQLLKLFDDLKNNATGTQGTVSKLQAQKADLDSQLNVSPFLNETKENLRKVPRPMDV